MSTTSTVTAPNGKSYTIHATAHAYILGERKITRGYVYALGHRVYGRISLDGVAFTPEGKWAFILAANTASVQPEPEVAVA